MALPPGPEEERLLRRLRAVSIIVVLALVTVAVGVATFAPFIDRDADISSVFVGGLIGALLTTLLIMLRLMTPPRK